MENGDAGDHLSGLIVRRGEALGIATPPTGCCMRSSS